MDTSTLLNFAKRQARCVGYVTAVTLLGSTMVLAADWPQFRGPESDGSTPEAVAADWTGGRPKVLWKVPAGEAFGSFAAVGDWVYFLQEREGNEVCTALNAADGGEAWSAPVDKTIYEGQGGNGPRTTPAVVDGKVYVLGTYLKLTCLDARDGQVVWTHDLAKEFAGQLGTKGIQKWGNAASPVVEGDLVIVGGGGPGQTFLAFKKDTGDLAWKSGTEEITHATPTPATIHGERQVIFFTKSSGLVSVRATDGQELWRYPFPWKTSTAASPIVGGDVVYCSAGYGVGAGACRVTKQGDAFQAAEIWRAEGEHMNHWTTPVYHDGHLYGIFGFKEYATAPLKCVEIATGKEKWSQPGFGSGGATILAGGRLVAQHDTGQLTLVDPQPDAYKQLGRIQPLAGKCWTMPAVANGKMFVRSTKQVVCLDVSETSK